MSPISERILRDHGNYRRLLDILERHVDDVAAGARPDYEMMGDIMHYMAHYPDMFHHPFEDKLFMVLVDIDRSAQPLVDDLLASGSFARQQVAEFIWLLNDGRDDGFRGYLEKAFADNRSWDRVFEEIILAKSDTDAVKGAEKFYRNRIGDLDRLTNDVSVNFFGVNVSCAQCHDHPEVPSWKQDHYYGMKSFFKIGRAHV